MHPKERRSRALSRREFLQRSAAAAAGIPMASALLAACKSPSAAGGSGSTPSLTLARPNNPTTLPIHDTNPAIDSGMPIEKGATLKLYNWDQYIYRKVMDDFAAKYGCDYTISTFNNMDEAITKIRSGQGDFDVFFPTVDVLEKLATFDLIQPINHDYVPNLPNVWPQFSDPDKPFYDVGQRYTVPYMVYSTGIGWRNDMIATQDDPWHLDNPYDIFWNAKYKGKTGVYDDYRETMGMALLRNGGTDVNTGDPKQITAARDALIEMTKATNTGFDINGAYEGLPKGDPAVHLAWSGDMLAAPWYGTGNFKQTYPTLSYWWPKDGKGVIGNDTIAILSASKSPVLAHTFVNYMLDFDVAMKNFSWVDYQPPQNDAPPQAFTDPKFKWSWIVPPNLDNAVVTPEDFDRGYMELELAPPVDALWHDAWEQVTSGG